MPASIDKGGLISRWTGIAKKGKGSVDEEHSGVVEGASHNLDGNPVDVVDHLVTKVLGFLNGLPGHSNL